MSYFAWILFLFGYLLISRKNVRCMKNIDKVGNFEKYRDIMLLINDVQQHYMARSVILIYDNDKSIETTTLMLQLSREFSRKLVSSLTLNFTEVKHYCDVYRIRTVKPLFVAVLTTKEEVNMLIRLSKVHEMSYSIWLVIFMGQVSNLCEEPSENFFNVAFDTEMLVKCFKDPMVKEWYSLFEDEIIIEDLANWDPKNRLKLHRPKSLYERRRDLRGKELRIAAIQESPFVMMRNGLMTGLFAGILQELKSTLNFSIKSVIKEDFYGTYNVTTGEWSGLLGKLVRGEADLGVAEFTMTERRLNAVDFTHPIMLSSNYLYMMQPDSFEFQWSSYFRVYSRNVWITLQAMWAFASIVITCMRFFAKEERPLCPGYISQNALDVWGIFWLQSIPDFPSASSMRIAYFSLLVTAVILTSAYSACLISYLTVYIPSLPFKNFAEFAEDGSYKLVTVKHSNDYEIFASSKDKVSQKMFSMMDEPRYQPRTVQDGFKEACKRKVAFYQDEESKNIISSAIPCNVVHLESEITESLSMILTKNSQYRRIINHHLRKFKDVGIMNHLRSRNNINMKPSENKFRPMSIGGVVPILLILGIGMGLSLAIFCFERMLFNAKGAEHRKSGIKVLENSINVTRSSVFREQVVI